MEPGNPANSIIKYANQENMDLTVIAKKKKTDYKSLFKTGGTAKKVQEKAYCSIMLVETDDAD